MDNTALNVRLPAAPVDGFEITYFTIRHEQVQEIRLKYHVNSKWSDVSRNEGGADLVDQWQVFVEGYFSGRMEGWSAPATLKHEHDFATLEEAANALMLKFKDRAEWHDNEARRYREYACSVNVPAPTGDNNAARDYWHDRALESALYFLMMKKRQKGK